MTTTTAEPTLDQVLTLAHKLPRHIQAELITRLVQELAAVPPPPPVTNLEGLNRFLAFAAEMRTTYPNADFTGRLEADRRERDAALRGTAEEQDVHT